MGTLVYLSRGTTKHPHQNKQLPTLDRVYMCVYTANVNVCTAYPLMLKIGRFLLKDKAKRFKSNMSATTEYAYSHRSRTKIGKKLKRLKCGIG